MFVVCIVMISEQSTKTASETTRTADVTKNMGLAMRSVYGSFKPSSAVFLDTKDHDFFTEIVIFNKVIDCIGTRAYQKEH
jgi:hypothetical protein